MNIEKMFLKKNGVSSTLCFKVCGKEATLMITTTKKHTPKTKHKQKQKTEIHSLEVTEITLH